jgi:small conductance mechanosensitive channel
MDQLELMLDPLTKDELFAEADGWLGLLKETSIKVSMAQLAIKKQNEEIEQTKDQLADKHKPTATDDRQVEAVKEEKNPLLEELTLLREDKTALVDRLNAVLKEINEKIGLDEKGKELDEVMPYRLYIDAVSGVKLDLTDTKSTWITIKSWLLSADGGLQWIKYLAIFISVIFVFWILSKILSNAVKKAIGYSGSSSRILNDFFINSVRRITLFIGILVALSAIDVNVAPIMAAIGAAGFVVAFALQSTLSNFASGIMIMFYRPFDVGDVVEVAGISGSVESMTLVSTTIMTFDNKLMIVPNNSIWGDVITNATHSLQRRVDMVFGIGYEDDIEQAINVMQQVLDEHPLVLKDPKPTIQLNELADSSVNFICRPWVKTEDYWTVYWEVIRAVKERFDAEGISIPYPQRDVHMYEKTRALESAPSADNSASKKFSKESTSEEIQEIDIEQDKDTDGD